MTVQSCLFSGKNKEYIINLSSAELAQGVEKFKRQDVIPAVGISHTY